MQWSWPSAQSHKPALTHALGLGSAPAFAAPTASLSRPRPLPPKTGGHQPSLAASGSLAAVRTSPCEGSPAPCRPCGTPGLLQARSPSRHLPQPAPQRPSIGAQHKERCTLHSTLTGEIGVTTLEHQICVLPAFACAAARRAGLGCSSPTAFSPCQEWSFFKPCVISESCNQRAACPCTPCSTSAGPVSFFTRATAGSEPCPETFAVGPKATPP